MRTGCDWLARADLNLHTPATHLSQSAPTCSVKRPAHSFVPLVTVRLLKMAFGFLSKFSQIYFYFISQALWVPSSTKMTSWSLFQKNTMNLTQAVLARQPLVLSMRVILFSTVLFAQQSGQWRLGSWQAKTTNHDPSHNKNRWRVWSSLCVGGGVLSLLALIDSGSEDHLLGTLQSRPTKTV